MASYQRHFAHLALPYQQSTIRGQRIMPSLPYELLYQVVGHAVTGCLHDIWWTRRKAQSVGDELTGVHSLLSSSHHLRDVTLQVLSDTLKIPRDSTGR